MYKPFFPNVEFAWTFFALLTAALSVAAYVDWKRTVIPKWITVTLLASGVLVSVVRGGWLGAQDSPLWILPTGNAFLGGLDGLLFSLIGCVFGFFMLFVLWILGTCGGGDVKLFAALGAWLGPVYAIFVLAASLVVLFCEAVIKLCFGGMSFHNLKETMRGERKPKAGSWRITYSLPVALGTVAVLLWFFRVELGLATSAAPPSTANTHAKELPHDLVR